MASIVITSGDRQGDHYPLGHRTNVVGRAESVPIQILDDTVSRKHLQICFDPTKGRYLAIDMGSRNGVFVNGVRIGRATLLSHRDRIRVGSTTLLFAERDLDESTAAWHRFKKAGERQRPTQFDSSVDHGSMQEPASISVNRDPLFLAAC